MVLFKLGRCRAPVDTARAIHVRPPGSSRGPFSCPGTRGRAGRNVDRSPAHPCVHAMHKASSRRSGGCASRTMINVPCRASEARSPVRVRGAQPPAPRGKCSSIPARRYSPPCPRVRVLAALPACAGARRPTRRALRRGRCPARPMPGAPPPRAWCSEPRPRVPGGGALCCLVGARCSASLWRVLGVLGCRAGGRRFVGGVWVRGWVGGLGGWGRTCSGGRLGRCRVRCR